MGKTRFQRPKGTADILPEQAAVWQHVEAVARDIFAKYGFAEIRTPHFESYDVFSRSAGETSDVVSKEMYDFEDKGGRHMALRPEGTAGVVRAYVENKLFGPEFANPYKVFYSGPMFRYERPQAGRFRQFHQIGAEAFGVATPTLDVEIIAMLHQFFSQLGLTDVQVTINTLGDQASRAAYRDALVAYLTPLADQLSADSQRRLATNPLRILDSKEAVDQPIIAQAPVMSDYLTAASQAHWATVQELLTAMGITYTIDTTLVRGLDYYNDTIFEIVTTDPSLSHAATLAGGGRYSGLVENFGGPETPGIGFGIGVERLLYLLTEKNLLPNTQAPCDCYVITVDAAATVPAMTLVSTLRQAGYTVDHDYHDRSLKAQFKAANRQNARLVATLGTEELAAKTVTIKRLADGHQVTVAQAAVPATFIDLLSEGEEL